MIFQRQFIHFKCVYLLIFKHCGDCIPFCLPKLLVKPICEVFRVIGTENFGYYFLTSTSLCWMAIILKSASKIRLLLVTTQVMTKFCTTGSWRHRSALRTPYTVSGRAHLCGDVIDAKLGEKSSGQDSCRSRPLRGRNKRDVITEDPIQIRIGPACKCTAGREL